MGKKRRQVAAPAAQRANREAPVDLEAVGKALAEKRAVYDELVVDIAGVPASLERTLLLHSLVALVVQNALMVSIEQGVSTAQIVLVAATGVWMMRKSFVAMLLPHVALRGGSSSEIYWRSAILILTLGGSGTWFYRTEPPLNTSQLGLFIVVLLLDTASIYLVLRSKGRLTPSQIVLSAVEATFLVAGFSTCLNHKRGLIFDEMAFALTAATAFIHVIVLLSAKYTVLHCFGTDTNGAFVKIQQRGAKLMEKIWQDIDRFEPEQLLLRTSKKKKAKNKSRGSSSKGVNASSDGIVDPAVQFKQSVFREPRVQLAILTLVQVLLLLSQLALSTFVLYSWEMMSALMLSSSHVLWKLGRVRRKVLSRSEVRSTDVGLAKHKIE
ncbi:putative Fluconazole resistance protein 1 [Phytophthora cinnamomi]|uniref:putative Fluconazole resistance protein 1 n=1 Tax=Phytophthora cinnamomi TaxID=4785 RepID=UPI0035593EBC|nr:putative Fluconazole resistance protein 1 [Phytophthora cinnamomi]